MDLEEWEVLPEDGFLEIHDDGGKMIFSRKYTCDSKNEFNMNYFSCSSPKSTQFVDSTKLVPFTIQSFQETPDDDHEVIITKQVITKEAKDPSFEQDHEVSQVFFKKKKENEYENMKLDSPNSSNKTLLSLVDADPFQFEEKPEVNKEIMMEKIGMEKENIEEKNGGMNILNRGLTGIGAICSFGVAAAATICIIFIGNRQKHKQNHKIRFQIFSDDKRMMQVVQHAAKLNEAISAVRGVPVTRAHITVGGYYDAL